MKWGGFAVTKLKGKQLIVIQIILVEFNTNRHNLSAKRWSASLNALVSIFIIHSFIHTHVPLPSAHSSLPYIWSPFSNTPNERKRPFRQGRAVSKNIWKTYSGNNTTLKHPVDATSLPPLTPLFHSGFSAYTNSRYEIKTGGSTT